jgi:acetyl esterase/lipase
MSVLSRRSGSAWNLVWSLATSTLVRALAWVALAGATGVLVRAEVLRPEGPEGVRVFADLVYRDGGGRRSRLDVYVPEVSVTEGNRPALIAIHGGGWRGGSKSDYGRSLAALVRRGIVVVAVDYRLSRPGAPSWPDNLEDVRDALRWVRRHAADYAIDPERIAVIGASAGGHLALLLGTSAGADRRARVSAVIDFYGPTDLAALSDGRTAANGAVGLLLGGRPEVLTEQYAAASPLQHIGPGGPPVLIVHGTDDELVPLEQSRALASALERAGVRHRLIVVEGARHGFGLVAGSRELAPDILAFLRDVWDVDKRQR